MGYFKHTLKGFSWIGAFRISSRVISFIRTAILARILYPEQFGLFGIAALVLAFLETFTETGINVFLIQEEEDIDKYINTAWIISIIRGLLIGSLIALSSPIISRFFKSPQAQPLLLLISLVAIIRGFINPAIIKFQKELQFNKEFWLRFSTFTLDSTVAVFLALLTKQPSSLVFGVITGAVLEVILSFVLIKPTPQLRLNINQAKKIINKGKWVTFAGIFTWLNNKGCDVTVGKLLDTASLGLYQMAYRISTIPLTEIKSTADKVTFPVYSKIAGDRDRLKKAYKKILIGVSLLVIPTSLVIFLFPQTLIRIILGDRWLEATATLRVIAVYSAIRGVTTSIGPVLLSLKKQNIITRLSFIQLIALAIFVIPLTQKFGIVGTAYSAVISTSSAIPFVIYYLIKIFNDKK